MDKIKALIKKGTQIINSQTISVGADVDIERISGHGVTLYPGTVLLGSKTWISDGVQIGNEGPVTIDNCYIGPHVKLKSGYFNRSVFLNNSNCGSGSHIRQGTILEESASTAHTVGLKQTILFPYVTLGSLINFCDCFMSGGTDRQNHSEVGSSYIHFNFTPNQDKATPSLIGDVSRGVMLNNAPIFLGGQGGLIGPCRIAYGTVIAAGTICRSDQLNENHLVFGVKARNGSIPYLPGGYIGLKRIIKNNINYIANLYALRQWYGQVRSLFVGPDLPEPLMVGLKETLTLGIEERVKQLGKLHQKLNATNPEDGFPKLFASQWPNIKRLFANLETYAGVPELQAAFLKIIQKQIELKGLNYLTVIKSFSEVESDAGTKWLDSILQKVSTETLGCLAS